MLGNRVFQFLRLAFGSSRRFIRCRSYFLVFNYRTGFHFLLWLFWGSSPFSSFWYLGYFGRFLSLRLLSGFFYFFYFLLFWGLSLLSYHRGWFRSYNRRWFLSRHRSRFLGYHRSRFLSNFLCRNIFLLRFFFFRGFNKGFRFILFHVISYLFFVFISLHLVVLSHQPGIFIILIVLHVSFIFFLSLFILKHILSLIRLFQQFPLFAGFLR